MDGLGHIRHWIEAASLSSIVGTLTGVLPPVASFFAIAWYCVLLYDRFTKR